MALDQGPASLLPSGHLPTPSFFQQILAEHFVSGKGAGPPETGGVEERKLRRKELGMQKRSKTTWFSFIPTWTFFFFHSLAFEFGVGYKNLSLCCHLGTS